MITWVLIICMATSAKPAWNDRTAAIAVTKVDGYRTKEDCDFAATVASSASSVRAFAFCIPGPER